MIQISLDTYCHPFKQFSRFEIYCSRFDPLDFDFSGSHRNLTNLMGHWPKEDFSLDLMAQVVPLMIWAASFWSFQISWRGFGFSNYFCSFFLGCVSSCCYEMTYRCFCSDFCYPHVNHSPPKWSYIIFLQRVVKLNLEFDSRVSTRSNNFFDQNFY